MTTCRSFAMDKILSPADDNNLFRRIKKKRNEINLWLKMLVILFASYKWVAVKSRLALIQMGSQSKCFVYNVF